jgi:hypothetical protein
MIPPCLDDADPEPGPVYWWHDVEKLLDASVFEAEWCAGSGFTTGDLHLWGRWPEPADPASCDDPDCAGWHMGHQQEDALVAEMVRRSLVGQGLRCRR